MDPQQTWADMLEALYRKRWSEAKERADTLLEWLQSGGFPPVTIGDNSLGNPWHRTIASFVCRTVANRMAVIQDLRQQRLQGGGS
ncbi:MAG: hypothetical protein R3C01_01990 [Planctomycetaceae bacterium]